MKWIACLSFLVAGNLLASEFKNVVETCQNAHLLKASLQAECKANNGGIYKTEMRLRGVNVNSVGKLALDSNSAKKSEFHTRCRDLKIDDNWVLGGRCQRSSDKKYVFTSLDLAAIIWNYNGTLVYPLKPEDQG